MNEGNQCLKFSLIPEIYILLEVTKEVGFSGTGSYFSSLGYLKKGIESRKEVKFLDGDLKNSL